jgi:hypothetical protein
MNKNLLTSCLAVVLIMFGLAGCDEKVPVSPKHEGGGNPYVSGTPEERIRNIEADTSLNPEERARRIQVIKERNGLQ